MALQAQYRSPAVERSFQPGEDRAHRPSSIIWVAVGSAVLAATAGILVGRSLSTTSTAAGPTTVVVPLAAPQTGTNANAREGRAAAAPQTATNANAREGRSAVGAPSSAQTEFDANLRAHLLALPPTTVPATGTNANAREGRTAATAASATALFLSPNFRRDVTATVPGTGIPGGKAAATAGSVTPGSLSPNLREDVTATHIGVGPGAASVSPNLREDVTATHIGIGPGPVSHSRLGPVERHRNQGVH